VAKFSGPAARRPVDPGLIQTSGVPLPTHEGGAGWARTLESELFLLASSNFVREDTFYESAGTRDSRFTHLVHEVTKTNPAFIAGNGDDRMGLAQFLRSELDLRSAPMVMACEYIKAGGPYGRSVLRRVLQRADELTEALGYWLATHGRPIPAPLKRGLGDAAHTLLSERAVLKYDTQSRSVRMGDVIELARPRPSEPWQDALFRFLIDRRHNQATVPPAVLQMISLDHHLQRLPVGERRAALRAGLVARAGWDWQRLSGWLPNEFDAEAWEAVIPSMGYMALIRNLRTFDEIGVSPSVKEVIRQKLSDPAEIEASRQFPYRFWAAYKYAPSLEWGSTLEAALDHTVRHIPSLPGRTLVLIDISQSMDSPVSKNSKVRRWEVGALFAAAQAKRAENADVVLFASHSMPEPVTKTTSVLRFIERVGTRVGTIGFGTMIHDSMRKHWDGHQRVVVFSDEQGHDSYSATQDVIPVIHMVNLAGYRSATLPSGPGRYTYTGFTDATFTLMQALEEGQRGHWLF
jgi:hypothetical protein